MRALDKTGGLAALSLCAALCGGCVPAAPPVAYACTPQQGERAHAAALRDMALINSWDAWARRSVYQAALARHCAPKP
jgi:hypothetical protein